MLREAACSALPSEEHVQLILTSLDFACRMFSLYVGWEVFHPLQVRSILHANALCGLAQRGDMPQPILALFHQSVAAGCREGMLCWFCFQSSACSGQPVPGRAAERVHGALSGFVVVSNPATKQCMHGQPV